MRKTCLVMLISSMIATSAFAAPSKAWDKKDTETESTITIKKAEEEKSESNMPSPFTMVKIAAATTFGLSLFYTTFIYSDTYNVVHIDHNAYGAEYPETVRKDDSFFSKRLADFNNEYFVRTPVAFLGKLIDVFYHPTSEYEFEGYDSTDDYQILYEEFSWPANDQTVVDSSDSSGSSD